MRRPKTGRHPDRKTPPGQDFLLSKLRGTSYVRDEVFPDGYYAHGPDPKKVKRDDGLEQTTHTLTSGSWELEQIYRKRAYVPCSYPSAVKQTPVTLPVPYKESVALVQVVKEPEVSTPETVDSTDLVPVVQESMHEFVHHPEDVVIVEPEMEPLVSLVHAPRDREVNVVTERIVERTIERVKERSEVEVQPTSIVRVDEPKELVVIEQIHHDLEPDSNSLPDLYTHRTMLRALMGSLIGAEGALTMLIAGSLSWVGATLLLPMLLITYNQLRKTERSIYKQEKANR